MVSSADSEDDGSSQGGFDRVCDALTLIKEDASEPKLVIDEVLKVAS